MAAILNESGSTLPTDHTARMKRALLALDGLSIGDAFGASICTPDKPNCLHRPRPLPKPPWYFTDDTEMAMGIVEVLDQHGCIDQAELALVFALRYWADVKRGYGPSIHTIFGAIRSGVPWRTAATALVSRQPSRGLLGRVGA
jgi:ADP-ribosylglycohydrolase